MSFFALSLIVYGLHTSQQPKYYFDFWTLFIIYELGTLMRIIWISTLCAEVSSWVGLGKERLWQLPFTSSNNLVFSGSSYTAFTRTGWLGVRGPDVIYLEICRGRCCCRGCGAYTLNWSLDTDTIGRPSVGSLFRRRMDGQINRSLVRSSCAWFSLTEWIMNHMWIEAHGWLIGH